MTRTGEREKRVMIRHALVFGNRFNRARGVVKKWLQHARMILVNRSDANYVSKLGSC